MKRHAFFALLLSLTASAAHAGQATITETDDAIIVEYQGGEEGKQATLKQNEEREKKEAEEAAKRARVEERERIRAARRGNREE